MYYERKENGILIPDGSEFDPAHILDCGQIFRYERAGEDYVVYSRDKRCRITHAGAGYFIEARDVDYFVHYFDLERSYSDVMSSVSDSEIMEKATRFGHGIRILKQDFAEMIISFIISANNHIPRIKTIISRLCQSLGEDMGGYYAFPTIDALAGRDAEFYFKLGAGYRAEYLESTAKTLASEDLSAWLRLDTPSLCSKLLSLKGVGPKVADCILLFGAARTDVFPVDTWMEKVHHDYFGAETNVRKIREYFLSRYGNNAGFAQQYLFYYKRELEKKF